VPQSVRPTERRSERTGGFSKVALGHHVVSWASGLAGQGSATVHPLGHVYCAFLCGCGCWHFDAAPGRRRWAELLPGLVTIRTPVRAGWKPTPVRWRQPPHGIRIVKSNTSPLHPSFDCDHSSTKMFQ
jgi:hypothetical protein